MFQQDPTGGPVEHSDAQAYEINASKRFSRIEALDSTFDDDDFASQLYNILADGAQPNQNQTLTPKEQLARREQAEQTWAAVRKWLEKHPSPDERATAAYTRGEGDQTPLHLMCKVFDPPVDCFTAILEAAPDVASWADSVGGWLPLHLACAACASYEVLMLLIQTYPDGKLTQDLQRRTPLHFCATQPSNMIDSLIALADTGAAELTDRGGMLPMHYACAYGTSPEMLGVLADAYPAGVLAKEQNGRTPMHLALSNAHRGFNAGVIEFLVECGGQASVNMRDNDGYLPIQLLVQGLSTNVAKRYDQSRRNNISKCLKLYLAANPHASADFLTALQDLPDWAQDVAVVSPHVRDMLNKKIVQRFHTSILMLDGYFLLVIIGCFEVCTSISINNRYGPNGDGVDIVEKPMNTYALTFVFIGIGYFIARELIQVISMTLLGNLAGWFQDGTNWLDMTVIVTVLYYAILMLDDDWAAFRDDGAAAFRAGVTCTKGVLWCAVIYYLKSTLVDFAVFVGGVFYVVERLAAFLIAVLVILLIFAQMFFFIYKHDEVCTGIFEDRINCEIFANETNYTREMGFEFDEPVPISSSIYAWNGDELLDSEGNVVFNPCVEDCRGSFPHCTFANSFIKVYSMMMGEIGSEVRYTTDTVAQILYLMYAFVVVILLSNVLIAIVTDLYEIIQNDRAAIVFWQNRLDFVSEMDAISEGVRKRLAFLWCACIDKESTNSTRDVEQSNPAENRYTNDDEGVTVKYFREAWDGVLLLFDADLYADDEISPADIEFYTYHIYRLVAFILVPIWLFLGVVTAGWLWPPQVREYLYAQTDATVSRAELERKKLEQLKEIESRIGELKEDILQALANDHENFVRMKSEIDMFQGETLQDLLQVKELMSTLLDLGNNS